MDVLQTLGVALGLAAMAGLNLYLTVFVTGLAIHFGWVALPLTLAKLHVLGDPWIIGVAGVLYFLEFFADKIPWIDTANDFLQTLIRPLGGALLAVLALGDSHPVVQVVAALLAGGAALTTHVAKVGARLVANTSPEPISNIGLSLGEDVVVLGGLGLVAWSPIIGFVVVLLALIVVWTVLPRLFRAIKATLWLAWRKLNDPPAGERHEEICRPLPSDSELLLRRAHATPDPIVLSVPCLSGGGPRLPRNLFGWLVKFETGRVFFVSPRWFGPVVLEVPMEQAEVERQSKFLAERLAITPAGQHTHVFLFDRGRRLLADQVAEALRAASPATPEAVLAD